jgi:DNA topoisomerase-1
VARYNAANREVAILCNHQKTVSKAAETQLEKLGEKLEMLKDQKKVLGEWRDLLKKNKANQIPLSDDDGSAAESVAERVKKAMDEQSSAKTNDEKIAAKKELDEAKAEQKKVGAPSPPWFKK